MKINRRWLRKGFWAGLDQGLFATSNFAVNILLARWLTPYEYGAFGLVFAIFMFVGNIQAAAFLEPMLVFGPGKYKDRLSEYLGTLVYGHFAFATVASLALLSASLGFALWGSGPASTSMLALALAEPFILLLALIRRACYARLEPHLAASGGAWYMALMLAGAYVLYRDDLLSGASAFAIMGISSLAVSIWLAVRLRVKMPLLRDELVRDVFGNHWRYGRWAVINQGLNWVPQNFIYIILPVWGGLAAGASFRALMNLIRPMLQFSWALSNLLLPALVRARDRGRAAFNSRLRLFLILFTLAPAFYWILLGLFHYPLISWLYGGKYTSNAGLLWLFGLSPVCFGIKMVMGYAVKAFERPDWLLFAYVIPAVVAVILETGLVYLGGLAGGAWGLLLSQAIAAVVVTIFYQRLPSRVRNFPLEQKAG